MHLNSAQQTLLPVKSRLLFWRFIGVLAFLKCVNQRTWKNAIKRLNVLAFSSTRGETLSETCQQTFCILSVLAALRMWNCFLDALGYPTITKEIVRSKVTMVGVGTDEITTIAVKIVAQEGPGDIRCWWTTLFGANGSPNQNQLAGTRS